jgi:hypothetical protein
MARVKIAIDGTAAGLETALKGVRSSLEGLKEMAIGAFSVEAIKEMVSHTMELGKELTNTALRLNMTVEQVQILRQAAKDSGVEFEKLQAVLDKVSVAKAKALGGDKNALAGFAALGIDKQQLQTTKSVDLLFGKIAESVKAKGGEAIAGPLGEIIGRGFGEILPLLKSDVQETGEELKKLGGVMSTDTAVKLKVLGDQFELLGTQIEAGLGPCIISSVNAIKNGISSYLHFIDNMAGNDGEKKATDSKDGFWSKAWADIRGAATGVVGLGAVAAGGGGLVGQNNKAYQLGVDELMKTETLFDKGFDWMKGGILEATADKMSKGQSLGNTFDDSFIKPWEEKNDKLKAQIKSDSDINTPTMPVVNQANAHKGIYSDTLTSTGNMLGASYASIKSVTQIDLAKQQLAEQKKMNDLQAKVLEAIITAKAINPLAGF